MATVKITKKQIRTIIAEEMAHSAPPYIGGPAPAPKEPEPPMPKEGPSAGDEAIATFLYSIATEGNKNAVAKFIEDVGMWPWRLVQKMGTTFCDKMSSYDAWGDYQREVNQVCKVWTTILNSVMPQGHIAGAAWALAKVLNVIPPEDIQDFVADSYPDTAAGRLSEKARKRREEAKAAAKEQRKAVKESLRKIIRKETRGTKR